VAGLQYSALGGGWLSGPSRHSANLLCAVAINSMKDVSNSNQETTLQKAPHPRPSTEYSPHQTRVQRDFVQPLTSSDRSDIPSHKLLPPKYFSCLVVFVACCAYRIPYLNLKIFLVKQIHLETRFCMSDSQGNTCIGEKISKNNLARKRCEL
jgi:hypothetical protein